MSTKSIDWSKAPEGATHFEAARDESECDVFWRVKDGVALQVWRLIPWKKDPSEQVETFTYGLKGCDDFDASRAVPRPVSWSGEGLPPVGTVCEWLQGSSHQWERIEILAYNGLDAWIRQESGRGLIVGNIANLRPLRTPEQIAADERENAISLMIADSDGCLGPSEASKLYDVGYRKAGAQP